MYITRFTTVSKEIQDYFYQNVIDAENHLNLFLDDESKLYRSISVIDLEKDTVLGILPFINGRPQKLIVHGSIVTIKPEWCSPGEEKYIFRVSNIHEQLEHACITCLNSIMTIKPSEIVDINMIMPLEISQDKEKLP